MVLQPNNFEDLAVEAYKTDWCFVKRGGNFETVHEIALVFVSRDIDTMLLQVPSDSLGLSEIAMPAKGNALTEPSDWIPTNIDEDSAMDSLKFAFENVHHSRDVKVV